MEVTEDWGVRGFLEMVEDHIPCLLQMVDWVDMVGGDKE